MPVSTPIPMELVDIILDYAHADRRVLANSSLVCKAWLPSTRYHLFSKTTLHAENALSFANLISSPSSTLPPFVRGIEINDNRESTNWLTRDEFLSGLAYLTDYVTALSITVNYDNPLTHSTLFTLSSFENLIELKLLECVFEDFSQMQELVCSFPVLESLHLEAEWPEHPSSSNIPPNPSLRPPSTLRELDLRCEMSHVLGWFLALSPVPVVSALALRGIDTSELPTVNRYLQTLGQNLTHLMVLPSISTSADLRSCVLDLSRNSRLQFLKLEIDCDAHGLYLARDALSQLNDSHCLKEMELAFYSLRHGPHNKGYWGSLHNMLNRPRFHSLQVTIRAMIGGDMIKEILPQYHARGTLRVQHG